MEKYIGTKQLEATPMNLGDYNTYKNWIIPENENPEREGYLVKYEDGYESWSPKEVFESAYIKIEGLKQLEATVFPSEEKTLEVTDCEQYGGAHHYVAKNCIGFNNGNAEYVDSKQQIQFVHKSDDGTVTPGLQSEQVAMILLDRIEKLNARFPSNSNEKAIIGLKQFIEAHEERVKDRIDRGVMGDLKK